jgi:hypothetical protein
MAGYAIISIWLQEYVSHCSCRGGVKTRREPAKNPDLGTGLHNRYLKFQALFKIWPEHLNKGQFEKPVAADGDKCMPRLLIKYDTQVRQGTPQPMADTTYGNLSCAFDADSIAAYAAANATFMADMMMPGQVSIPKLQQLVLMDLLAFMLGI